MHCMAHSLNLCSSKAAEEVKYLHETPEDVIKEVKRSTARTVELKRFRIPLIHLKVFEIRWMEFL